MRRFALFIAIAAAAASGCASRPVPLTFEFEGLPNRTVDLLVTEEFGEGLQTTVFWTAVWTIPPGTTRVDYDACLPLSLGTIDLQVRHIEPSDVRASDKGGRVRLKLNLATFPKALPAELLPGALSILMDEGWNERISAAKDFQAAMAQEGGREKIGCTFPKSFWAIREKH